MRYDEATGRWWKYTKRTAAGYTDSLAFAKRTPEGLVAVWDAHSRNMVRIESGLIVPIDVIITQHT